MFGETSLLAEQSERIASVITDEQTELLVINRNVFDRYLRELVRESFSEKGDFVTAATYFNCCPPSIRTSLMMLLQKKTMNYGETLVGQGQPLTAVYFILRSV